MGSRHALLVLAACVINGCARYAGPTRAITFYGADDTRLEGTLVLPSGATSGLPGVVLMHGAEPATRSMAYRMHANVFVERGIAVLVYDKRGAGESAGDHDAATYSQLVEDGIAAVEALRSRAEIDPAKVGLMGASESGWFTPEIAERVGGLAFVINKVGPCLSWRDTNQWEVYNDLLADGVAEESAKSQTQILHRLWSHYIQPDPVERQALEAILDEWTGRPGSILPPRPRDVSAAYVADIAYDPGPYLERVVTPMLYVYGSEDPNVPTSACVDRLGTLRAQGRPVEYHVMQGEGHELGGVGLTGYRFAKGYAELIGAFAARHIRGGGN